MSNLEASAPSHPAAQRAADSAPVALTVEASDGVPLSAHHHRAEGSARGAVLIVPAMGVPQSFYAPFARWLASEGFHALTFDYRGMGASLRGKLRDVEADILTWAERDVSATLRALEGVAPGLPITWIGHSLGGQIIPFVPGHERVAKLVTVATGSGYWRENAAPLRRKVWLLWWGVVPITTPLFGYFPGRSLGLVGDLPRGVIEQWRRWCLDREYAVGVEGPAARARFASVRAPLTALSFTDDEMMSARNVESIHGFYTGAERSMRRFDPRELGVAKVGHFGFFRKDMRGPIWERHVRAELASL